MAERMTIEELKSYLWQSAVLLRTNIDAGAYKQYIFPLMFFKRICDVYDGFKVSYTSIDSFIWTVLNKEKERKLNGRYQYWLSSDLIIIDDFLYTRLTDEELIVLYKATMLFNETRSLMIISNRSIPEWKDDHNDAHLVNTLIDRLTANSQTIHLK